MPRMTHHARIPRAIRPVALALAASLVLALAACSRGNTTSADDPLVATDVSVIVSGAGSVRGVQLDMRFAATLTVLGVAEGPALSGATCAHNVESGRARLGCANGTNVALPFTAWVVTFRHAESVDVADAVTSMTCTASDALGNDVAVTCSLGG